MPNPQGGPETGVGITPTRSTIIPTVSPEGNIDVEKIAALLTKGDVGLGSVDNQSAASIAALVTKSSIGLGNVQNISPADMPISDDQAAVNSSQEIINQNVASDILELKTGVSVSEIIAVSSNITSHFDLDEASGSSVDNISGLTLSVTGAGSVGTGAGTVGDARSFDDSLSTYLESPSSPEVFNHGNTPFGFSVWVKPTSVETTKGILSKGPLSALGEWSLWHSASAVTFYTIRSGGAGNTTAVHPSPLTLNAWNCIQAWYDGVSVNIMVNGGAVTSVAASFGIWSTTNPFRLGYAHNTAVVGTRNIYDGLIDEFVYWSGTKKLAEIRAIYQAGLSGVPYPYVGISVPTISDGLAGKWTTGKLNDSRPDSTPFSRTLNPVSSPVSTLNGWDYDGVDDYHESTDAGIDPSRKISLVALIKPSDVSSLMGVLGKGDASGNQFSLGINASSKAILSYLSSSTGLELVSTGADLTQDKVNAVMITSSGSEVSITTYDQASPDTESNPVDVVSKPFRLGYGKVSATAGDNFFDGQIREVCYYDRVLLTEEFKQIVDGITGVMAWGDSLTVDGTGGNWPNKLSALRNGFLVDNYGYSGQGTPQIRENYETENKNRSYIHLFWGGNNSAARGVALETADTAAMVAGLKTDRFLVLGLPNRTPYTFSDSQIADAAANYDPLNAAYSSIYGERFLDLQDLFINHSVSADANDDADKARGIVQRSFKDAGTHFSEAGGTFIADKINEKINSLGWGV